MVNVPSDFQQIIHTWYPPSNSLEFERWFCYRHQKDVSDREYLGVLFCSYFVNNDYGKNEAANAKLQALVDGLDEGRKYFVISQFDDGVLVDWKGKDVLEFNMSKNTGYPLPLLGIPPPHEFNNERNIFASFIGSHTHPIREYIFAIKNDEYYISDANHDVYSYCQLLSRSIFSLCPRGYGLNSFRIAESLQYGAIPVYISDDFIEPHYVDFNHYGIRIEIKDAHRIDEILKAVSIQDIVKKQDVLKHYYNELYTYEGTYNKIIEYLKNEQHA